MTLPDVITGNVNSSVSGYPSSVIALLEDAAKKSIIQLRNTLYKIKEIKKEIKVIDCIPFDKSKKINYIFDYDKINCTSDGYITIENRYIISCDESFSYVGDRIIFVRDDGTCLDCIIGQNTKDVVSKNKVSFFIDESTWKKDNPNNINIGLFGNISKIVNIGKDLSLEKSIQTAINWAVNSYSDKSIKKQSKWGDSNYDCASFVINAFEAAGIPVKESGASYTGNMRYTFSKVGFECYDFHKAQLQNGDILLKDGNTGIYIGNGKNLGVHGDNDEINISDNGNNWTWVLRYKGNNTVNV